MNKHLLQLLVEVVQTRLLSLKNEVGLEGKHVVEEASKFIDLAAHFQIGPGIVLHESAVVLESVQVLLGLNLVKLNVCLLL